MITLTHDADMITLTHDEWARVKQLADTRMKSNNGHSFVHILKTRCQYCGRSPRQNGICRAWFQTFISHVDIILMNLDREREAWEREATARNPSVS